MPSPENPLLFLAPLNGSLAFFDRAGGGTLTGSGAVRYMAAEGARTNLVKNPSFETGTTGYSGSGASSAARITTDGAFGSCCLDVASATTTGGLQLAPTTGVASITSKVAHTYSFYAKYVGGATDWDFVIYEYDAAGNYITDSGAINWTPLAGWTRYTQSYTPTGVGTHRLTISWRRKTNTAGEVLIDAVQLETGSTATDYFDGTTGAWLDPITGILGTAHASPSVSQATAWVEEGTTNTVPDPSFEAASIATNWNVFGSATAAKVTTHAWLGSNGGKISCTASTSDGVQQAPASAGAALTGQTWTLSGRIRAFASGDVGKTVVPGIRERTAADGLVATNSGTAVTLTDAWQEFKYTVALAGGGTVAKAHAVFTNGAAVAVDFVLDAVQLEQKAYATSYCDGAIGTGYAWSGTAHASSSTRTAASIRAPHVGRINAIRGAVYLKARPDYYPTTIGGNSYFHVGDYYDAADRSLTVWSTLSRTVKLEHREPSASVETLTTTGTLNAFGSWSAIYADWDRTNLAVILNSGARETGSRTSPSSDLFGDTNLHIGSTFLNTDGLIGPVAISSRPLTAKERAILASRTSWGWSMLRTGTVGLFLPI